MSDLSSECRACRIGQFSLYAPTFRRNVESIAGLRTEAREIPAQRRVFREGENVSEIFTIKSGWACRYRELADGKRQILSFFVPGDMLPLEMMWFPNSALPFSVKALTAMSVCVFPLKPLCKLLSESSEQVQEVEATGHGFLQAHYARFVHLGRKSARSRLAHFFLDMESRLKRRGLTEGDTMFFPLRQEHLADSLGLTPSHVNRSLARFRSEGILTLENQMLSIFDRLELGNASDEP